MNKATNQILIEKVENGFIIRSQRTVNRKVSLFGGTGDSSDNCRWYVAANDKEVMEVLRKQLSTLKTSIEIEEELKKEEEKELEAADKEKERELLEDEE